jgi:TRAP transporter TAXI family solute receptor
VNLSMYKKLFSLVLMLTFVFAVSACGNSSSDEVGSSAESGGEDTNESVDFSLGAGSQGGVYYPVGVGVADILTNNMDGVTVTPEVTGASLENAVLLGNEEVEIGVVTVGDLFLAAEGQEPFKKELNNLTIMYQGLKPGAIQVLTLKDNGIDSIEDLKGKNVAVGPQGGGGWKAFSEILPYYDMSLDDMNPNYISYGDSIEQLSDGTVDATVITAGLPTPAVKQLASQEDYKVVPFEEEKLSKFLDEHKYYTSITIKKDFYEGMSEDVKTFATVNVVAVREDVDEDLVYEMDKVLFDNIDKLREAHPSIKTLDLEMASSYKGFKYHPGSVKFFEEEDIEVPSE